MDAETETEHARLGKIICLVMTYVNTFIVLALLIV